MKVTQYLPNIFVAILCGYYLFKISSDFLLRQCKLINIIISITIAFSIVFVWLLYPCWLTTNMLAISIVLYLLLYFPNIPLKTIIIAGLVLIVYDVAAVFILGIMQKLAGAALNYNLPLLIIIPKSLAIKSDTLLVMGLGDIIYPGLLIRSEIYRAKTLNMPQIFSLPLFPLALTVGYICGIAVGVFSLFYFQIAQPALLYIIPLMLIALLIAYFLSGILKIKFTRTK